MPDTDGCFATSRLTGQRQLLSLYEIVPSSDNDAAITICSNEQAHARALNDHRVSLLPACVYEQPPRELLDTRIVVQAPGRAVLEDQRWRVVYKIRILFT